MTANDVKLIGSVVACSIGEFLMSFLVERGDHGFEVFQSKGKVFCWMDMLNSIASGEDS